MNKKFVYYFLAVLLISILPFLSKLIIPEAQNNEALVICKTDTKVCEDGSSVLRVPPNCEFAHCIPISTSTAENLLTDSNASTTFSTSTSFATSTLQENKQAKIEQVTKEITSNNAATKDTNKITTTVVSRIDATVKSIIQTITSSFTENQLATIERQRDASITPSTYIVSTTTSENNSVYKPLPPTEFAGQKYLVKDNNILTNDNKVIYTIPDEVIVAVSSPNSGWTNTTINVVPVGNVAPILNAIPIKDLPGKYYLSENSFGNLEACEFSNKIFILDTYTNTVQLMYEENSSTLSRDDPRACNSEIFLLATEGNNLILKYHTIGTNTLCDSAWSEPDKTFYLDVTKLQTEGMKHYVIPGNLTAAAEQEEEACRAGIASSQ